ncbi:MAG: hypothetical protein HFE47_02510 [Clostridia bacterium]|nr:hypothetical protein [Clostridia bacterium]
MKKRLVLVLSLLLLCCMALFAACGDGKTDDNQKPGGDDNPPLATEATYKTEYWLEGDDGTYAVDATYGETLTGTIDATVKIEQKEIKGYIFESDHKSNVVRGKVLADGSLVLKAYYSKDYTGRVTFETELPDTIDLLKGTKSQLAVTVKVDGETVTDGIVYSSSTSYVGVSSNGELDPKMRGESDISVGYKNVSKTFHATVYDKFIATETDFWSIYDHLSYWYKFTADVTLSECTVEHFADPNADPKTQPELYQGYGVNKDFTGVLDGGNHTLTYSDSRLFHWVSGAGTVIRNITLNANGGFYWGSTISYGLSANALVENVTVNAQFVHDGCWRYAGGIWMHIGEGDTIGNGGMFAMVEGGATVKDCTVNLDITQQKEANIPNFGGIAYLAQTGALIEDCNIISTDGSISVVCLNTGATVNNSTVSAREKTTYSVEYYKENESGAFVKDDMLTETFDSYVGFSVSVTPKSMAGFAFDTNNENNVLSGTVAADGALTLKLYYNKSTVLFETETPDSFDLVGANSTCELAITVTDNGEIVTHGIQYTATSGDVLTVSESGMVSAIKGGKGTVTVEYAGATKEFTVTVYDKLIASEADWFGIYENDVTLAGWYKFSDNVTLTQSSVEYFNGEGQGHTINHTFSGRIDGNGKSLTYTRADSTTANNNRLFHSFTGTIENLTYNAGSGFYWGSTIAYFITGGTFKNVTVTTEFDRENTYQFADGFIVAPGSGVFGVWSDGLTAENCTINVTLSGIASASYYCGVAYELKNSTLKNVTVNSTVEIPLFADNAGTPNTVENSQVVVPEIVWTEIASEEDWWNMYKNGTTISGHYKLTKDVTLENNSCAGEEYKKNYVFAGVLNGGGYTLKYAGNRLFHTVNGTIENITLDAGEGYYWGSAIAFFINNGAVLKNIAVSANFTSNETRQYSALGEWLTAPGTGGLCVWLTATVENVTINVTLSGTATNAYNFGIAYDCTGSTLKNITVNSASDLTLYSSASGAVAEETNCAFNKLEPQA